MKKSQITLEVKEAARKAAKIFPRGRKNAKSALEIGKQYGLDRRTIRSIAAEIRAQGDVDGHFLCSSNAGYWLSKETADLKETDRRLRSTAANLYGASRFIHEALKARKAS